MEKIVKNTMLLNERNKTFNELVERMKENQLKIELERQSTHECIKYFFMMNPIELFKAFYFLHDYSVIVRRNVNGYTLTELDTLQLEKHLEDEIVFAIRDFQDELLDLEDENVAYLCEQVMENSQDLYLPVSCYTEDTEYFDNWVYGDTYIKTTLTRKTYFKEFIANIINEIGEADIKDLLIALLEEVKEGFL